MALAEEEVSFEDIPGPVNFEQTLKFFKPLGIRVRKSSLRVSFVRTDSNAYNKIFVGDKLMKINGRIIQNHYELQQEMKLMTPKAIIKIDRGTFSWCEHLCTTIEVTQFSKNKSKASGRAIDLYNVFLHCHVISDFFELDKLLGASICYDARERVQLVDMDPEGLAAAHLQAGDIIHEVNDAPIASKTMIHYRIRKSFVEQGYVKLKIERLTNGGVDNTEQTLLAPDVVEIGEKQGKQFELVIKGSPPAALPAAIGTKSRNGKRTCIVEEPTELSIQSDYDPSDLKPCRSSKKD